MLFVLFTATNPHLVFTSMSYPLWFFIANIPTELMGFPVLGILFAVIWEKWMEPKKVNGVRKLKVHAPGTQDGSISSK